MSLIAGICHSGPGTLDRDRVRRAARAIADSRRPSAQIWLGAAGVLTGRATPVGSTAWLESPRGGSVAGVVDARLDDRETLARALRGRGWVLDEADDAALVVAACGQWGKDAPRHLLGDFAFAVWEVARERLICGRDPIGVRPLFYCQTPNALAFASGLDDLLRWPGIERRLDEGRVAEYLAQHFEDREATFYRGVRRLTPGHCLVYEAGRVRLHRYWAPDPTRTLELASDAEYEAAFRDTFTAAVACRLERAPRVALALSGGLDSSSIACTARSIVGGAASAPLATYSAVFPGLVTLDRRIAERPYIDAVLAMGGFRPHFVEADRIGPLIDRLWSGAEPVPAPNLYMDDALFRAAAEHDDRVFLSGTDGDTTVSYGYERLAELARRGRWDTLHRESVALAARLGTTRARVLWRLGIRPLVPPAWGAIWSETVGTQPWPVARAVDPGLAARVHLAARLRAAARARAYPRTAREAHCANLDSGLLGYALELLTDTARAHGVECRFPFFDRRLVDLCVALPAEQKLRGGWTRSILRRAMAGTIPDVVGGRTTKGNLSASFKRGLLARSRAEMDHYVLGEASPVAAYVDVGLLRQAYARFRAAPLRRDADALTVFLAVVLGLWLDRSRLGP